MNIFITGGASGIGKACVEKFYNMGSNVFFIDIHEENSKKLLESFEDKSRIDFRLADVRDSLDMESAVKKAIEKFGFLDSVFVNAGCHLSADILNTTEMMWDNIININLKGTFLTIKATLPYLIENCRGSYVLMGSDQSLIGKKKSFVYGATKGAIAQMTKSLSLDFAKDNIRFNCIGPATIETPFAMEAIRNSAGLKKNDDMTNILKEEAALHPIGRMGKDFEVANLVYFLASEDSSFITGTIIPIDGGYTAK